MKTNKCLIRIGLLVTLMCSQSCATQALWEYISPSQPTWSPLDSYREHHPDISMEELNVVVRKKREGVLVEKSLPRKSLDIAGRVVGTPATLVVDTAVVAAWVAGMVLYVGSFIWVQGEAASQVNETPASGW